MAFPKAIALDKLAAAKQQRPTDERPARRTKRRAGLVLGEASLGLSR